MKDKLLAALKLKFPGVSDATLTRIADKKAGAVTEESQIDGVVESVTVDVVIQSEVDAKVTDSNKKAIQNYEKAFNLKDGKPIETGDKKPPQTPPADGEVPAWAKALIETTSQLSSKLSAVEQKTKQEQLTEKLMAKAREKKIPEKLFAGRVISDESEIDTTLAEVEAIYTEVRQGVINDNVPGHVPGASAGPTTTAQVEATIKDYRVSKGLSAEIETKK